MRVTCACLTLLSIAGVAAADCFHRQRVVVAAPAVVQAVVKKEVAVVTPVIAPIAVYAPIAAYAAVYSPPPPAPAATVPAASGQPELKTILDAIQSIDRRLQALEGGGAKTSPRGPDPFSPGPLQQTKAGSSAPPTVFGAKCASCHEAKVSGEKGGAFTLLEGAAPAKLTDRQIRKVMSVSYSGRMPPKGHVPLTDEEVGQIVAYLDQLK